MARYIDAEKAIKAVEDMRDCYNGFSDSYDKAAIVGLLEEVPTEDVVPVKHGKWIINKEGTYGVCSLCQHTELPQYDGVQPIPNLPPYCSMCGAKMEEVVQ